MKKVLVSVIALAALAGCSSYYDYYKGGVQYIQDGEDCIYYAGEYGNRYSNSIRMMEGSKKVVYRNTRCADLFRGDNFGTLPQPGRLILDDAAPVVDNACACKSCATPVVRRKYVIMPAM